MTKSPDAFRTIREVAEWLDTPAHVLRFWESRFAQVKPVKRAGGRRYYRPSDMELLGGIKQLLHEDGLTIRGVQKLLREQGVHHVASKSPSLGPHGDGESASGMARRVRSRTVPAGSGGDRDKDPRQPDSRGAVSAPPAPGSVEGRAAEHGEPVLSGQQEGNPVRRNDFAEPPSAGPRPNGMASDSRSDPSTPEQDEKSRCDRDGHDTSAETHRDMPPDRMVHLQDAQAEILPERDRASDAARPNAGPILSVLWERRHSGNLGDIGPIRERAGELLRSMQD